MIGVRVQKSVGECVGVMLREVLEECAVNYNIELEPEWVTSTLSKYISKPLAVGKKKDVRSGPLVLFPYCDIVLDSCVSIKMNQGLYSQCMNERSCGMLCGGCSKKSEKNGGVLEYGSAMTRASNEEFRDSKGRMVVAYGKVVKKNKWSEELVMSEAAKYGIPLDISHLSIPEKIKKDKKVSESSRGRPKKTSKVIENEGESQDLFMMLQQQTSFDEKSDSDEQSVAGTSVSDNSEKSSKSDKKAAKAAKKSRKS